MAGNICCYYKCGLSSYKIHGLRMFRFPTKNLSACQTWILHSGNRFSCDCRLDWMYVLHDKTAQSHIRNSLEELQCSMNNDRTTATTEVVENLVCSPSVFSNSIEENFDQDDYFDKDNEADSGKVFLMSIPVRDLPCPAEYRPTPITVKQGSPPGVNIVESGGTTKSPFYLTVFLFVFIL